MEMLSILFCNSKQSWGLFMILYSFESSVYMYNKDGSDIFIEISLIYKLNKRGLRIDPWGTPDKTFKYAELKPPITTLQNLVYN